MITKQLQENGHGPNLAMSPKHHTEHPQPWVKVGCWRMMAALEVPPEKEAQDVVPSKTNRLLAITNTTKYDLHTSPDLAI